MSLDFTKVAAKQKYAKKVGTAHYNTFLPADARKSPLRRWQSRYNKYDRNTNTNINASANARDFPKSRHER